jgi:outer membrane immunogenic protein
MKKTTFTLALALAAASSAAGAADLPVRQQFPIMGLSPVYNWTGFYVGLNAGYGWGTQNPLALITDRFDRFDFNVNGWLIGATVGGQIQAGRVVLGVESDIAWADITGRRNINPTILGVPAPFTFNLASNTSAVSTARVRLGYAADNWLFYSTGGAALLRASANATNTIGAACGTAGVLPRCSGSEFRPGISLGAGVEWGFAPNWSAKLEYLWVAAVSGLSTERVNLVRGGVNYRFGGI